MFVVDGDGPDLSVRECLANHQPRCLAASPATPDRVFIGTFARGLLRSTDGGTTFARVGESTIADRVMSVTVSPHDPETVWVGTEPSAVHVSRDGGDTWTEKPGLTALPSADEWYFPPRPDTHHVRWLAVAPADPDHLYVGIEAGAFVRSDDGGNTWQERPPGSRLDNHTLAVHGDAPDRVYAAAGDGYAESTDCGATWDHPQEGLDHRYCWSVAPAPEDPETVVLSAASGPGAAHRQPAESYVYRRSGDEPWTLAMDGLPEPDGSLRPVLSAGAEAIWLLSNRGLFRSVDAGLTWDRVLLPGDEFDADQRPRGLAIV